MLAFTKWIAAPLLAAGLMFASDAPTADAGNGFFRIGGVQLSVGGGHYGGGYYNSYRPSYRSSYGYGHVSHSRHGYYHDTSHYDWHPTEVRRHGNHYDVTPGHYDYHRTGHFHH